MSVTVWELKSMLPLALTLYLAERSFVELQGFQRLDFRGAASAAG